MSKALVLGAAALVFSAASASAQIYADPVADLTVPADGYAAPAPPVYAAPPIYAAPAPTVVYTAPTVVYTAPPPPVYVAPAPVYAAPLPSHRIYAYAPHWGVGYGHGWYGYAHHYDWR